MFRKIADLTASLRYEGDATLSVFRSIPDELSRTAVAEGHRNLKRIAWHLTETLHEMPASTGLSVSEAGAMPATMAEVADTYERLLGELAAAIAAKGDDWLAEERDMYGEKWKNGFTVLALVLHQAHHRGQMTVLMRQAGLAVRGVYGPAKEGWAAMGMNPPEV